MINLEYIFSELSSLNLMNEKDEKVKAEKKDKFAKETVPFYMNKLDAVVKENNGYIANGKVCILKQFLYLFMVMYFDTNIL